MKKLALAAACLSLGLLAPRATAQESREERPRLSAATFEGHVRAADGSSAEGALVVTSAGGQAVTGPDGAFRIELALPPDAREVQVTAVHTRGASTGTASTRVRLAPAGGTHGLGTLALSSGGCQPGWLPTFGAATDLRSVPSALLAFDDGNGPALYVSAGSSVQRLEGTRWTPLGSFNNSVWALAAFDDGQGGGPALYAGGDFTRADGLQARGVARWDGTGWAGLGSVLPGQSLGVFTMAVFDDGQGGGPALYVGGDFTVDVQGVPVNILGRWNGTSWSGVGSGLTGNNVADLAVFDDGLGGGPRLFAVEGYLVGGEPHNRIQIWDGVSWSLLTDDVTSGPSGFISSVEVFDDGLGGGPALYFGGSFSAIAGTPASNIVRWDGTGWSSLGSGPGLEVWELAVVTDALGTALFAAGTGGRVRRWNGTSWSVLPLMLTDADVTALAGFDDGSGPALFVGSAFGSYNDADCHITKWDGVRWSTLGTWLNARVNALAVFDDGLGGGPALYAGGLFSIAGDEPARGIARWDGTSWSRLGTGVFGTPRVSVQALAVHDDGSGPALYVGGEFTSAGGGARNVAKWDGLGWAPLGPGLDSVVYALASFDDGLGAGPMLVAGGLFGASGAVPVARVARWNGTSWGPLGSGVNDAVFALAVHDDGSGPGPALFAGGRFTTAGGAPASKLARWDGVGWAPLGSGVGSDVQALAGFDDGLGGGAALYAGGSFTAAGGAPASRIARWDGAGWSALGSGVSGTVQTLASFDDGTGPALYAAGGFLSAGGVAAARIARWDGTSWSPLGSGLGTDFGSGEALAVFTNGANAPALVVGGGFLDAGGTGDSWLGLWQGCLGVPPEITCPAPIVMGTPDASGGLVEFVVTAKGPGSPPPTVDCVPPSGSLFPLGTTLVTCTATDAAGLQSSCEFTVSVYRKARRR